MTRWGDALLETIREIPARPHADLYEGAVAGASAPLTHHGELILRASDYGACCAETFEAFWRTAEKFPALMDRISVVTAKKLRARTFITDMSAPGWWSGIAGALVETGLADAVSVEKALPGDAVQCEWDASRASRTPAAREYRGHTVVALGIGASPKDASKPALWAWSSNVMIPAFDPPAEIVETWLERDRGTSIDYFVTSKAGKNRVFHCARIKDELLG